MVAARRVLAPHIPWLNIQLVGAQLQEVQRLLGLTRGPAPPGEVLVVGMYGMGGVGKTTLATKIRDEAPSAPSFRGRIVYLDIGERCEKSALKAKRRELLELLCPGPSWQNSEFGADRGNLRGALSNGGPLLLILDDLWTRDQLLWLLGHDDSGDIEAAVASIAAGSRLLLISRNQSVLMMEWSGFSLFELDVLDCKYAEELLYLEAKRQPWEFKPDQLQQALQICDGLPLALQVFGRQLRNVQPERWQVKSPLLSCAC